MSYSNATVEKTKIPLIKRFKIYYPEWKEASSKELKQMINIFLEMKHPSDDELTQFFEDVKKINDYK